ncbi:MAG: sigma 54-interacting transcriptional regulator [Spirochaetales bacterium]|nr:sigma 54-interacting transcriptional regulator [Spirochaetales bacterium]
MIKVEIDQQKFQTLLEINAEINSNYEDGTELLTKIIESATLLTEGEASSLMLINLENNRLYFEIALGTKGEEVKKYSLELGEGIAGWVARNNMPLLVNDVESDSRFNADISRQVGFPTHSILAVPMRVKDKCIGVLEIINKKDGKIFTDEDLQWLQIFVTQAAIALQNAKIYQKVRDEVSLLKEQILEKDGYHTFIGQSSTILDKLKIAYRAAESTSSILLLGESGVGKELFAEQIHLKSKCSGGPFIRVNCAALPEHLLESELFGHVKGAFTGAVNERRGKFEIADGGTIFLDEIGDLPLNLQSKLLRIIQHKSFEKVGSNETITINVRIIAATNKDIEREVQEKRFRADLFYRLNVLPVYIPPLRERNEDIPLLADYFLSKFKSETKKQINGFTKEAMNLLLNYSWPGNVRELENAIERAVVISQTDYLTPDAFILNSFSQTHEDDYMGKTLKDAITLFKKKFITKTLKAQGWKQTKTAKALNIQRTYLSRLIKELNIIR